MPVSLTTGTKKRAWKSLVRQTMIFEVAANVLSFSRMMRDLYMYIYIYACMSIYIYTRAHVCARMRVDMDAISRSIMTILSGLVR